MQDNELIPYQIVHPGLILEEELVERGWTQQDLADIIQRPIQMINEIIKATKQITPQTALELAAAFGTSEELWLNLETNYRLDLARKRQSDNNIARRSRLYTIAPIAEMTRRKWLKEVADLAQFEDEICKFFAVSSLDEPIHATATFRQTQLGEPELKAELAWLKRVENVIVTQKVNEFDLTRLRDSIPKILQFSTDVSGIALIPQILAKLGIYFTVVKHLRKTYLDGATFYFQEKPVIALTLRHDRIDSFWFTLFHELAHICLGHPNIYLENNLEKDLEINALNNEEIQANEQAKEWLIDQVALTEFITNNRNRYSRKTIEAFARSQQRHPGLILGQLQHRGIVNYHSLRDLLVKVSPLLEPWIDNPK